MRCRSLSLSLLLPAAVLMTACGGGEVTVRVMSSPAEGAEAQPVDDLEVSFLPYDRDSIFSTMAEQTEAAEPQPSEDLQEQLDQVAEAQEQWRESEEQWGVLRDSLKRIRDAMQGLDRRSREYLALYEQFDQLEPRVQQLEQRKDQLFQRFDSLQKATLARTDSLRAVIGSWEDEAFRGYTEIVDSILEERGVEVRRDTTGSEGYASANLSGGSWWVYTRTATGPYEELYWNVPITPGQVDTLVLDRQNAEVRQSF